MQDGKPGTTKWIRDTTAAGSRAPHEERPGGSHRAFEIFEFFESFGSFESSLDSRR
jgi:hypothetical protein